MPPSVNQPTLTLPERDDYEYSYNICDDLAIDDIQLAPKSAHKGKAITRTFNFPHEVLEVVCLYLSQATLRHCASLVCKQWYAVCNRFIRRVGIWKRLAKDSQDSLLDTLPRLNALECIPKYNPDGDLPMDQRFEAWDYFISRATELFEGAEHLPESEPHCLLHHIRDLTIEFTSDSIRLQRAIPSLLPGCTMLRTLKMKIVSNEDVPLFALLDCCPFLVHLVIRAGFGYTVNIRHDNISNNEKSLPVSPKPDCHQSYSLINFVLRGVIVCQSILEHVITTCPNLWAFRVRDVNKYHPRRDRSGGANPIDRDRLSKMLVSKCPRIEWIQLAKCGNDRRTIEEELGTCNATQTSRFLSYGCDHSMPEVLSLSTELFLQNITVLEIPRYMVDVYKHQTLSRLLRYMPNLLHLDLNMFSIDRCSIPSDLDTTGAKGSNNEAMHLAVPNKLERLRARQSTRAYDTIHPRLEETIQIPGAPPPHHWQCHHLRTLRCKFVHNEFVRYVTQHCPQLEELYVAWNVLQLCQLDAFPSSKKVHIDCQDTGENDASKIDRNAKGWPNSLIPLRTLMHLRILAVDCEHLPGMLQPSDFEYLWLPNDSQKHCWPHLESFRIRYANLEMNQNFQLIMDALQDMRPAVEFRISRGPSLARLSWDLPEY
ncbi:hypothetical protein BGZ94_000251 [Podila epigama]|nr:hypothetical protein BGZ94_000251 [Podila epigama]